MDIDGQIGSPEWIESTIRSLGPWHHDIEITQTISTGKVFAEHGTMSRDENQGISLISPKSRFLNYINRLYPEGLQGIRFLDCACNGGIYCFLARELGADYTFGFDIRKHWIDQALFVQQHRSVSATDKMTFLVLDLYELPEQNLAPFNVSLFNGIFYHLPDPIHGLKIVANLTRDVIIVNSAVLYDENNPRGMTPRRRPVRENSDNIMSGKYSLAWFPNGPEAISEILRWLGFDEIVLYGQRSNSSTRNKDNRGRVELIAAREKQRLKRLRGKRL